MRSAVQPNRYGELREVASAQTYCTRALALLEADFRALALLALADWQQLELVESELFAAIAALQRPSWGTWNFLVQSLRKARKAQLRAVGPAARDRLDGATTLATVLAGLDANASPELAVATRPLVDYLGGKARPKRVADVLALPIALRNRVAHFPPTDDAGWLAIREALAPLIAWHAEHPQTVLAETREWPALWFSTVDDEVWAFNGVDKSFAVAYASPLASRPRVVPEQAGLFVRTVQRLLGRTEQQEQSFHRLLAKLAPEEIRGVVLGDFLVGPPVARGGFAMVHVGRQLSTGRKVAVKLLHDGLDEEARVRFQQEAAFLSRIAHPAVVGVISFGEDAWSVPRHVDLREDAWFVELGRGAAVKTYLALEWIDGLTLEELFQAIHVAKTRERPALAELRRWFREAADALAAVHAAGLIHRDIKPGNLMLAADHQIRLMDFGVARSDDENRTLMTRTGLAIGTPPYMSPEQIRARDVDAEVGPSSDIYSLAATFYELATGRRLFEHDRESAETVRTQKLRGDRPARPRLSDRDLPWELETILVGALEPELVDRYQTAAALARDLDHWERDEPIEYRRPGVIRRAALAYRRNRTVTRLVLAFVVLATAGIVFYVSSVVAAREVAEEQRQLAELEAGRRAAEAERADAQLKIATRRTAELLEEQGRQELVEALPRRASVLLAEAYAIHPEPGDPLRLLLARGIAGLPLLTVTAPSTTDFAFLLPDGDLAMEGNRDIEVRDVATGGVKKRIAIRGSVQDEAWLAPDGRLIVRTQDGTSIVDPVTAHVVHLAGTYRDITSDDLPILTPDGTRLVTRRLDRVVIANTQTGATLVEIRRAANRVSFDRTGRRVFLLDTNDRIATLDAATGAPLPPIVAGANALPRYSLDGRRAVVTTPTHVWILDGTNDRPITKIPLAGAVIAGVNADGSRLVIGIKYKNAELELRDGTTGDKLATLAGTECSYRCEVAVEISRDGRSILGRTARGTSLWSAATGLRIALLTASDVPSGGTAHFSPDGLRAVTTVGRICVWDLRRLQPLASDFATGSPVAIDLAGTRVATVTDGGTARGRIYDARTGALVTTLAWDAGPSRGQDGGVDAHGELHVGGVTDRRVLTWQSCCFGAMNGGEDATLWDLASGRAIHAWPAVGHATASTDGKRLAFLTADALEIWSFAGDGKGERLRIAITGRGLAWSPDDTRIAVSTDDKELVVVDATTGSIMRRASRRGIGGIVRFSSDGRLVADDQTILDASTGRTLDLDKAVAALSPDGRLALTDAGIFETAAGKPVCTLDGATIRAARFDRTARFVLAVIDDEPRVFDTRTCKLLDRMTGTVAAVGDPWNAGRIVMARSDGTLVGWEPVLERRTAAEIKQLVDSRSGWKLVDGALVPTLPPAKR